MGCILLAILASFAVGTFVGKIIKTWRYKKLQRVAPDKPEYEMLLKVSPIEYERIVTGNITLNGLVGEIVQMAQQDLLGFERKDGDLYILQTSETNHHGLSEIQKGVVNYLFQNHSGSNKLEASSKSLKGFIERAKYLSLASLKRKGWEVEHTKHTSIFSTAGPRLIILSLITLFLMSLFGVFFALADRIEVIGYVYVIIVTLGFASVILWSLYLNFKKGLLDESSFSKQVKQNHRNEYEKLRQTAIFMEVSGADLYTPDIQALKFNAMDNLYPYWVALGHDRKLVDLFKMRLIDYLN